MYREMSDKSRKILIFSTSYLPHVGGAETAIKGITDQFTDYEFDLITARRDDTLAIREKIGNINVFRVGKGNRLDKLLLPIRGLKKAVDLHRDKNYDLIFSLMASYGGLTAARFKKAFPEVPLLLNLQEGRDFKKFNFIKAYFFRYIIKSADFIVPISEHLKNIAIKTGADKNKIKIIPNGVDMVNFTREFSYGELSELRDRLGIRPDEKVIITASRLTQKNGVDSLIKAVSMLGQFNPQTRHRLIVAGEGKDRKKLMMLVTNLGLSDQVIFVGSISQNLLPKYLSIADVFVRPSRSEGLGSAFLEAMAAGLPVIGTRVGGIPDFLKDGETGIFCKVDDPKSVAEKINLLIQDTKLHNHIMRQGYKMVVENYSWVKIAGEYEKVFNSLIK